MDEWAREEATQEANARDSKGAGEKGDKGERVCSRKVYPLEAEAPQFYERERVQKLAQAYYERPSLKKKRGGGRERQGYHPGTNEGVLDCRELFFLTKLIASHTWKNFYEKSSFFISKTSPRDNHKKKQIKNFAGPNSKSNPPAKRKSIRKQKTSKKTPVLSGY